MTNKPSIDELLGAAWEALAALVEHRDCPGVLVCAFNEMALEASNEAAKFDAGAVEAARLRGMMPAIGTMLLDDADRQRRRRTV